jgi:phosphopantothenoylcysteine decarboxylase/phosphopantothenate--cysteine ligase
MHDHPGVLAAIDRLESWGVDFVDPRIEEGKAKIASEDAIVTATARAAGGSPLDGRHVVVTAGATSEAIDPVRVLTNRASGKTGRAVARACRALGADVTLVHDGDDVPWADTRRVESAGEMLTATREACAVADALVSAAAISDYTVEAAESKIRSGRESLTLELTPTPKLIDAVRDDHPEMPIVGFKAETAADDGAMVEQARATRDRVDLSFVVANDASVMGDDETRTLFVRADDATEFRGSKDALGVRVARELAGELG